MILSLWFCALLSGGPVICIDPGHPSEIGRGTSGRHASELSVAWKIACLLRVKLERDGYTVVMTKSKVDQFVLNRRRAEIANAAGASLMLRLHCDASAGEGFAVYYPDRQGTSNGHRGPGESVIKSSRAAAVLLHEAMRPLKLHDNGIKTDAQTAVGARNGALIGSIYSKVPTVLVEMVVLTNRTDEQFIESRKGSEAMALALARGAEDAVRKRGAAHVGSDHRRLR